MNLRQVVEAHRQVENSKCAPPVEGCEHEFRFAGRGDPVGNCDRPTRLACVGCRGGISVRCNSTSRSVCGPCAETYRRRVARVFYSGWNDNPSLRLFFVTLTAPSEVSGHLMPSGEMCPCTPPEGISLAGWHADVGQRWSWFMTALRREVGDVQFCKAAEVQDRGAIHFHVLMRTEAHLTERLIRQLAIAHGFGHEVDVKALEASHGAESSAWYCAKYASKAADSRHLIDTVDPRTGVVVRGIPRLRSWTASRRWGLTMRAIKQAQASWARAAAERDEASASPARSADAAGGGPLDHNTQSYAASIVRQPAADPQPGP